jgi:O-acetylhomoserine/O-acetylserine sulfhydrylase-like pyridoxal-dependent enzyme
MRNSKKRVESLRSWFALSIGIEHADDIIADIEQALSAATS